MQGACDERVLAVVVDIRKKALQLVADPREIRADRGWFDVVGHINSVETEGVGGEVNGKHMRIAEKEVGLESRAVGCSR